VRNYRCKLGEIDLIMLHDELLVFVEVRYRGHGAYTDGAHSITRAKRQRITRAATHFLSRHPRHGRRRCRFDVVSVAQPNYAASCTAAFRCTWIRSAFRADPWRA
jgi:putative endonuclease